MQEIYTISTPKEPLPVIFDSPHSGLFMPDDFNHACTDDDIILSADNYVDQLFDHVTELGGTLLSANFPRSYIDVNRAVDDIDPLLLDQGIEHSLSSNPSDRSNAGIGLIRRLLKAGKPLYDRALTPQEIQARIDNYYIPYHAALKTLLDEAYYNFGQVYHIDCHSMPSSSAIPKRAVGLIGNQHRPADFVLGDRGGTTCDPKLTMAIKKFLKGRGYHVSINDPYKGVELVRAYSDPARGRHSLQIEINKSLYMNEETGEKSKHCRGLLENLEGLNQFICDYARAQLIDVAAD